MALIQYSFRSEVLKENTEILSMPYPNVILKVCEKHFILKS